MSKKEWKQVQFVIRELMQCGPKLVAAYIVEKMNQAGFALKDKEKPIYKCQDLKKGIVTFIQTDKDEGDTITNGGQEYVRLNVMPK